MSSLTFSGHETFHCRQFWLKKVFDFTKSNLSFHDLDAPLVLGVGKNMVAAMRYWGRCFQIIDDSSSTTLIASKLLSDKGWDPYLEDHGSLWLLHYHLVTGNVASTWSIIFNEIIKERPEFNSDYFISYIKNRKEGTFNENTLKKDFTVFYRTYFADFKSNDIEESFTGILSELNLLKPVKRSFVDKDGKTKSRELWLIERMARNTIPLHILLFGIIKSHPNDLSISFETLYNGENEIGSVFALSKEGLSIALENMAEQLPYQITYSNEAGVRELQFKKLIDPVTVLEDYYGK